MYRHTYLTAALLVCVAPLAAQHDHGNDDDDHHAGLHFAHPLIAESVSPDTKVRIGYELGDGDEGRVHLVDLEAEYAFHRAFSIEASVPYASLDPEGLSGESGFANVHLALKFANYAFERHGVLLGYGLELGLPTGSDDKGIGSDHILSFAPFLNLGVRAGNAEIVGFAIFEIPTNQEDGDHVETELESHVSLLYHVGPRLQALLELDGETVLSSEEGEDHTVMNLSPGLKVRVLPDQPLLIGAAVGFPLTDEREFDTRWTLAGFWHF